MELKIVKDYDTLSEEAADFITDTINNSSNLVMALATGRTPIGTYGNLVEIYKNNKVDFSSVKIFCLDEYFELGKDDRNSCAYYLENHLFKHINVDYKKIHLLNGLADNPQKECNEYRQKISAAGGIDLAILGIGENGHLGFNEPGTEHSSVIHIARLKQRTREK